MDTREKNGGIRMLKIERHNLIDQEIRKQGYVLVPDLKKNAKAIQGYLYKK